MKNVSLKFQLIVIFAIPTMALLYFSYFYIAQHYEHLQQAKIYKLSAEITNSLSKLLLDLQTERGLSAGFLVSKEHNTIQLHSQYAQTDKTFRRCLQYYTLNSTIKKRLREQLHYNILPYSELIVAHLQKIDKLRKQVLSKTITFEDEMRIYTKINQLIIQLIDHFVIFLYQQNRDILALRDIQDLKEYSGLSRAYIYHELLTQSPNQLNRTKIKLLIELGTNKDYKIDEIHNKKTYQDFLTMRKQFFENKLTSKDANTWFAVASAHLNSLERSADLLINNCIEISQNGYSQASIKLNIAIVVLLFIYTVVGLLFFLMLKILREDEHYKEELHELRVKAQYEANHDPLTGIANRKQLLKRLHEEFYRGIRHHFTHAFLFIDLDNFKSVNDTYGHAIGDALLIEVSKRLGASLRQEDFLARISGDEFAIMLLNLHEDEKVAKDDVEIIANKILSHVAEPIKIEDYELHMSLSVGVKLFPDAEYSVDDVVAHADTAMYEAKKLGKNRCVFFESLQG